MAQKMIRRRARKTVRQGFTNGVFNTPDIRDYVHHAPTTTPNNIAPRESSVCSMKTSAGLTTRSPMGASARHARRHGQTVKFFGA